MLNKTRNPNHPKKGSSTKVQPIRSIDAIATIKRALQHQPRNLCLFTLGVNTAYRASELLSLTVGQVQYLQVGDVLELKQSKSSSYRATAINTLVHEAIKIWLKSHPKACDANAPLFMSSHYSHRAISVSALNQLVKKWCLVAELSENYGSHSLRKTWGYHQRVNNDASVALLMRAYGHKTEAQTLDYLGILAEEIYALYLEMEI
jgi:integrase